MHGDFVSPWSLERQVEASSSGAPTRCCESRRRALIGTFNPSETSSELDSWYYPRGEEKMTFQAYIDNIEAKTGKTPDDFERLAEAKSLLAPGVKAGEMVAWLKEDFGLGHGHAMAIYATLKPRLGKR